MTATRDHRCPVRHRTWRTTAECMFPRAEWVRGEGPHAVLAHCRVLTVELHPTEADAETTMDRIDRAGCGGGCTKRHELVLLRR